jgi:hypothetical protein
MILIMAIEEKDVESIRKRLDLIASLLCLLVDVKKLPTITDQIQVLSERGLAPAEIGRIVGREANYVSASLKNKKKVKKNAE